MKIIEHLKESLLYIWQLPQNLLAILLLFFLGKTACVYGKYKGKWLIYCSVLPNALSLGKYLFIINPKDSYEIVHEYGHSLQSLILGPLYLIVIGIPSLLHNGLRKVLRLFKVKLWDYNEFYTERWANYLIKRYL